MVGQDLVDPLSSAPRFAHFTRAIAWPFPNGHGPWPDAPPRTWLLGTGWHLRHGLIDPRETRRSGP
jgi:hypothetical protein